MICRHCDENIRHEGLQLVTVADDLSACHAAPLRQCGYCEGQGCGSCEGYGEVYGEHETADYAAWRERVARMGRKANQRQPRRDVQAGRWS